MYGLTAFIFVGPTRSTIVRVWAFVGATVETASPEATAYETVQVE